MSNQSGERRGKDKNGLRLVHGSGGEVVSLTDIPGPIAESLRQQFSEEIAVLFRRANVNPALIYAFSKTGLVVTEENRGRLSPAEDREWKQALREYQRRLDADSKAVDLCYRLHHESGRSELSSKIQFAASELTVAVLNALDEGISSFAMEGVFLNAWLTLACRRNHVLADDREGLRQQFGAELPEIRNLLNEIYDDLPIPSWSPAIEKRLARIEAARAIPETWLGKPPASKGEAEWEINPAFEHLQFAIEFCSAAQVPEDVMESMFFRFWLRTLVLNDRLPERFFQTLDRNWELVHAQVQSHMARYAGPRLQ
ncbi:MAG: hypothetical protein ABR912_16995 [Terracidiphilus sp.]|jgi:hypothetical protein